MPVFLKIRRHVICVLFTIYSGSAVEGQESKVILVQKFESRTVAKDGLMEMVHTDLLDDIEFFCRKLCEEKGLNLDSRIDVSIRRKSTEKAARTTSETTKVKENTQIFYTIETKYTKYSESNFLKYKLKSTIYEPVRDEADTITGWNKLEPCEQKIRHNDDPHQKLNDLAKQILNVMCKKDGMEECMMDLYIYPLPIEDTTKAYETIPKLILGKLEVRKKGGVRLAKDKSTADACLKVKLFSLSGTVTVTAIIEGVGPDSRYIATGMEKFQKDKGDIDEALNKIVTKLSGDIDRYNKPT